MARHNDFGKWGEQKATEFLMEKGYRILERNWKSFKGEIDIIAMENDTLVFVEVKTRQRNFLVAPECAVDKRKANAIRATASGYIKYNRLNFRSRFDIVTVVGTEEGGYEINHIPDALVYPLI